MYLQETWPAGEDKEGQEGDHYSTQGNYSDLALQRILYWFWCRRACQGTEFLEMHVVSGHEQLQKGNSNEAIIRLLHQAEAFMVNYTIHPSAGQDSGRHWHVVRKGRTDNGPTPDWYLVDSLDQAAHPGHVKVMTEADWKNIHGTLYIIKQSTEKQMLDSCEFTDEELLAHQERLEGEEARTAHTHIREPNNPAPRLHIEQAQAQRSGLTQAPIRKLNTNPPTEPGQRNEPRKTKAPKPASTNAKPSSIPVIENYFHKQTQPTAHIEEILHPSLHSQQAQGLCAGTEIEAPNKESATIPKLKVMTLNVRGLHSNLEDVLDVLQDHQPDVLVLTETKLTRKACSQACKYLSGHGYVQRHSACQYNPRAGVTLLINKSFADLGTVETIDIPGDLGGYIKAVQLRMEVSTPLTIVGVYMPTSHPSDKLVRSQIYRRMKALTEKANDKEEGRHNIIFAGDFNATLNKMDRASGNTNPMDNAHQTQIKEAKLYTLDPVQAGNPRNYTWRKGSAEQLASRIDDMFTNNEALPASAVTQSINQSKRKTSNANGQTNLGHKHKAPDHNHEATQPMVDLPHTS